MNNSSLEHRPITRERTSLLLSYYHLVVAVLSLLFHMSTVQQFLDDLIVALPQVHAIIVTDEDGVSVLSAQSSEDIDNDTVKFSSLYHTTAAQTSKLGIGTNKFMVAYYTTHSIIQFAVSPLVVTVITAPATSTMSSPPVNIGIIIDAIPNIKLNLQPVAQHISAR